MFGDITQPQPLCSPQLGGQERLSELHTGTCGPTFLQAVLQHPPRAMPMTTLPFLTHSLGPRAPRTLGY